jgi:hypothetical protein
MDKLEKKEVDTYDHKICTKVKEKAVKIKVIEITEY